MAMGNYDLNVWGFAVTDFVSWGFAVTDFVSCFYDTVKPEWMVPQRSADPDEILTWAAALTPENHPDISSVTPAARDNRYQKP